MPKWKKDATEFTVSLGFNEIKGYWCTIPKPVVEALGTPKRITFKLKGKKAEIESSTEQ